MRTIIAVLFLILYLTIGSVPAWLILWIIGRSDPKKADRMALSYVNGAFRILGWISGSKVTVKGRENIPADRPVVYISNHRSYFDVVYGYPQVVGLCGFVAKKQVEKVPSLRVWMRKLHCLFLDRDNLRGGMATIKEAVRMVKEDGISVWICPEGTRGHEADMLPFKEGSFKIAELAGCPVVPVAITHTDEVLELHFPWIRPAEVTLEFGEPIETEGMDRAAKKALPGDVREIIRGMIARNP